MRAGSLKRSRQWAGILSCASRKAEKRVRMAATPLIGSQALCQCKAMPGVAQGVVSTSASSRLDCTWLARWDADHKDPWLILTDLEPEQADVAWYGMRAWIECGFKDTKRGGWNWHQTKMQDPARAQRHWLAMVVSTLWVISVGGEVDAHQPASSLEALPEAH